MSRSEGWKYALSFVLLVLSGAIFWRSHREAPARLGFRTEAATLEEAERILAWVSELTPVGGHRKPDLVESRTVVLFLFDP